MQNILNNNVKSLKLDILRDKYYDFMLYKGDVNYPYIDYNCFAARIMPSNFDGESVYSTVVWNGAVNENTVLNNVGFTGVDNGLIKYEKDKITNKEFLELYTGSTLDLGDDKRLFLHAVSGNTKNYTYNINKVEDYFVCKGGFLQGFYKVKGYEYQTLPNKIECEWNLAFQLRPQDYEISEKSINKKHPENSGIFFYMGTRAENKFWHYYKVDEEEMESYKSKYTPEYIEEPEIVTPNCDYIEKDDAPWPDEFWEKTEKIETNDFKTKDGIDSDNKDHYEIKTDNKFIFFNRTKSGFTVDNWEEGTEVIIEGKKKPNINWFPLMNRTKTGYTVDSADEYLEEYEGDVYDVLKDIYGNSFALRINNEGGIGYRYGVYDCDEKQYKILEEYSKPIVNKGEWNDIVVKLKTTCVDKCDERRGRKMQIYFYVNGYLVFISKEVPVLEFKALNDAYQKQETVPYNISIGGGSQGLMEEIFPDYYMISEYVLPIEKYFGGSFIGDIKSFKFYTCPLDLGGIRLINKENQ